MTLGFWIKRVIFVAIFLSLGVVGYWSNWQQHLAFLPVKTVKIRGYYQNVDERQLEAILMNYVMAGFLLVDIDAIKYRIEALPWIEQVSVRRKWPDTIMVEIVEQVPVARWGDKGLLNNKGQVFKPAQLVGFEDLPMLSGPDTRQKTVMENYHVINRILRLAGVRIQRLALSERLAWQLWLDNGVKVDLGRVWTPQQLRQFVFLYNTVLSKEAIKKINRVDLRYTHGVAVEWG